MKKIISYAILLLSASRLMAQEGFSNIEFVENKGQWDTKVLLKGQLNNGSFFLQKNGFTVLLHNSEELAAITRTHLEAVSKPDAYDKKQATTIREPDKSKTPPPPLAANTLHSHSYSVSFVNSNEQAAIIPDKTIPGYNNYFIGNDPSRWASNCNVYQGVTYKNIYSGIDVRYYTSNGKLKYDIIVHPGADLSKVALKYEGTDGISVKNNILLVKTSIGTVNELKPYAYLAGDAGREEVRCRYRISNDNILHFDVKNYDRKATLVIDPTLVFSTFTGSQVSNWGFTATPGPEGTFFAGGIVFGDGFPVSSGAFQTRFRGGRFDVGIMKFSSNGRQRLYATYIGGSGTECPHSMYSDPQGNLVVLGRTNSPDFPVLKKVGPGGATDMFVVKLNATGTGLIGAMVIGGKKDDCVNVSDQLNGESPEVANSLIKNYGDDSRSEVVLDGSNNIYIAASTQSNLDFPVTNGVFQPVFGGGLQDGVVLKIGANCDTVLFASFLGGKSTDAAFVLKLSPLTQDIYVAGATASTDFPGNKTNVLQAAYQGGLSDAYITIISNDGKIQRKTTFVGTPAFDAIYGINFDKLGFPYIMGSTLGAWPVSSNVSFINPGAKQFVSKLNKDLSGFVYSTTFGTATAFPNISPVAFLVDRCENVYVSGWGGWIFRGTDPYGLSGTFGMPVTSNAIKKVTDGRDFYFIVIKKNASGLLYGTFFGQNESAVSISEHVDGGTSRYDQNGIIYQAICANCGDRSATPFPVSPNSWSPRNGTNGNGCNLAAVKISFNFAGVSADPRPLINGVIDSSGCIPLDVTFVDTLKNATTYIWNFGDGSPDTTISGYQVNHTYYNVGNYRVRLIAIDSNSCNISDTAYLTIRARTDKALLSFLSTKLPPCKSLTYRFDNTSLAPAGKPFSPDTFTWDFGDGTRVPGTATVTHTFLSTGTYIVRLVMTDTSYCNYPDSVQKTLRVSPLVKAIVETPAIGCAPYDAVFTNNSLGGQEFKWDFGDGTGSADFSPTHLYPDTGAYTIKLIVIDSNTCNIIDSTVTTIEVHSKPTAAFTDQPIPPIANKPTVFSNNSLGATHFVWYFGDDDSTAKNNADTVIHQYRASFTFQACLVAFNQYGCSDTACHPVETLVNPLLDVPNAFTPGRFGQNSTISVHGFGIISMTWRIYNRWGQKVFETNDPEQSWDGTFKGSPQPMDVYAYTLEASLSDGTKTTKKGDITLIR